MVIDTLTVFERTAGTRVLGNRHSHQNTHEEGSPLRVPPRGRSNKGEKEGKEFHSSRRRLRVCDLS